MPFRIVHEGTEKRYLTGADFDPEGFQIIGDKIWIGDEFGPYLIQADMNGKVEAVFETQVDGKPVRSPDHYRVVTPNPGAPPAAAVNLRRSKGYEGMAASTDGKIPLRPARRPAVGRREEGLGEGRRQDRLRILEFDVAEREVDRPALEVPARARRRTPSATST